jgi:putative transposase
MVDRQHPSLSVVRQCRLLGISRSGLYYQSVGVSQEDLALMQLLDQQYLITPFYGSRRLSIWLRRQGYLVGRKRVQRLMRTMGLQAIYRLWGLEINQPNQVWCADITYLPMRRGFMYLVVIMDWHSRYVLAWRVSNTLDEEFCLEALAEALSNGRPEIFNTDQGAQFTSRAFTGLLEQYGIRVSMDGKGRYTDNLFIERLWRSLKYEEVYLKAYADGREARASIGAYLDFYNTQRPHQALDYRTPAEVFLAHQETSSSKYLIESSESTIPTSAVVGEAGPALNMASKLSD